MATQVGQIYFDLDVKDGKFNAGLNQAEAKAKGVSGGIGSSFKSIAGGVAVGTLAVQGATMAFNALKGQVVDAFEQYKDGVRTQSQLNAVLKSTGSIAGVTAKDVNDLAEEIMNLTGIDDEAVVSAQNMMLTFTNIGKDVFKQATKSAIDMATAMNGGLTPSAEDLQAKVILLGKALQDPDAGLGALKRVGVNVDELSKKFNDSMTVQEKQKLILQELNTEFGGSAEAMGKTVPGQINILIEKFNNLKQSFMTKLIDDYLPKLIDKIQELWRIIKPYLVPVLKMLADQTKDLAKEWVKFYQQNKDWLLPLLKQLAIFLGVYFVSQLLLVAYTLKAVMWVVTQFVKLLQEFANMYRIVVGVLTWFNGIIINVFMSIFNFTMNIFNRIYWAIRGPIESVANWAYGKFVWLGNTAWTIYHTLNGVMHNVYWAIRGPFEAVFNWVASKVNWVANQLKRLNPLQRFSPSLVDQIGKGTTAVKAQYNNLFDSIGAGAYNTGSNLANALVTNNNQQAVTSSQEVHIGQITLGDQNAVDKFFDRLNRNSELAQKGLATI